MSEKENRLVRVDPTGDGGMLQYTRNQALNKRESFLSGATGAKLANSKGNFGRNRGSNKSNHMRRQGHDVHSKGSLLSLRQVHTRFGGHTQTKSTVLRQKSSGDASTRMNSSGGTTKPTLRLS